MATTFNLVITAVEGAKFDGEAVSVTVPGSAGEMTLLAGHEPIVTTLKSGTITVRQDKGDPEQVLIEKGVMECSGNRVTILM